MGNGEERWEGMRAASGPKFEWNVPSIYLYDKLMTIYSWIYIGVHIMDPQWIQVDISLV